MRLDRRTFARCLQAARVFVRSEVGGKARLGAAVLIFFLLAVNGLNVVNSYVGRDFMTAIAQRDAAGFLRWGLIYVGVFAASTLVAVLYRFTEERLGLLWREWLTRQLVRFYLDRRTYYRLREEGTVENPDQRIAEDARAFTTTTLSFALMFLNASFTIVAFSGVMWSISPRLFAVAAIYAVVGSILTVLLGRPLIWLNYNQADREAAFRGDLVHVRENAESIAILHRERRLLHRLEGRIDDLVANFRRIIEVNRNLGFFTTGYNYMIQLIPALIVAPIYMRGEVEFGVIPQASMAFSHLVGAFSLIVTQFQSISSYAAVVARLSALAEIRERQQSAAAAPIEIVESGELLQYEGLTLRSPRDGRVLIRDLWLALAGGTNVVVRGDNQTAKIALFRATAGIWDVGGGRIVRPRPELIQFVPERPYLPPGTLRDVLLPVGHPAVPPDEQIVALFRALAIDGILVRIGGLDVERDWDHTLSLAEQQLVTVARVILARPRFVLLDRIATTVELPEMQRVLDRLGEHGITYVSFVKASALEAGDEASLTLAMDGSWAWRPVADRRAAS